MIINDEPSTLLDSYALSKILLNFIIPDKIKIVVNNVIDSDDFEEIYNKLSMVTKKFLKIKFEAIGFIPYQRIIRKSILNQELATNYKDEDISFYFESLANYFINEYNVSEIIT
jgi:flagellar biosynthesis protein FlhG